MGTFSEWTERYKLYEGFLKALGEYRLNQAKANYEQAKADGIRFEMRKQEVVINQLRVDLYQFNRGDARRRRELASLKAKEKKALLLIKGRKMSLQSHSTSFSSYSWFESRALLSESGDALFDIEVKPAARKSSNFIALRSGADRSTHRPISKMDCNSSIG